MTSSRKTSSRCITRSLTHKELSKHGRDSRYFLPDHLKSANVVTDASGTVIQVLDHYTAEARASITRLTVSTKAAPSRLAFLALSPFQKFLEQLLLLSLIIEPRWRVRLFRYGARNCACRFRRVDRCDLGRRGRSELRALDNSSTPLWHLRTGR
jgi:hypothetical protein